MHYVWLGNFQRIHKKIYLQQNLVKWRKKLWYLWKKKNSPKLKFPLFFVLSRRFCVRILLITSRDHRKRKTNWSLTWKETCSMPLSNRSTKKGKKCQTDDMRCHPPSVETDKLKQTNRHLNKICKINKN